MSFKMIILQAVATSFIAVLLSVNVQTLLSSPYLLTLGLATIGSLSVSSVYLANKADTSVKDLRNKMDSEFGQVKTTLTIVHTAIKELKITKKDKQYK